jgi:hypothetical protein
MDPAYAAPPLQATVRNRMEAHVKAIAVINIVFGVVWAVVAAVFLVMFGIASAVTGATGTPSWIPGFLAGLGIFIALVPAALAVLCFLAGAKLLARKRSGKALGIITAAVSLPSFPLGTAYGVYAIWVLVQRDTDAVLTS